VWSRVSQVFAMSESNQPEEIENRDSALICFWQLKLLSKASLSLNSLVLIQLTYVGMSLVFVLRNGEGLFWNF
jgi:hypothetical protein